MVNQPGQGGKGAAQAAPQGKQAATAGEQAQGKSQSQGAPQQGGGQQAAPPNIGSLLSQLMGSQQPQQGQQSPGGVPSAVGEMGNVLGMMSDLSGGEPGFPIFSPAAQGFQGASSSQQNPNEGGASSSQSALTNPSTTQGGMGT